MGLPLYIEFAPLRKPKVVHSLALAESTRQNPLCAHVHIGKFSSELARTSHTYDTVLLDKGVTRLPCELDLAYSEIASYLEDEGTGANVFIEPFDGAELELDVLLQRSVDGEEWVSEALLGRCVPGGVRLAQIPELAGDRARIHVRCTSPKTPSALVRVWANEPRPRHILKPEIRTGT